jgi:hypothetical protein
LPTLYALAIATALCIPYVVLPPSEWEQTYVWSSGRVLSQITPIALMGLFLSVLPLTRRNGD